MAEKKFDFRQIIRKLKRPTVGQMIWWGIGLVVAIAAFLFLRGFVTCWRLTSLPGMAPLNCPNGGATVVVPTNPQGTPLAQTVTPTVSAPEVELPPPWDGASRVTALFIGLDFRDWEANQGPPRSDTMILLTIDPISKTAGMLAIPRDMWVNIPGMNTYGKINTAYALGELYHLPGRGPGLAMKTVEAFIGVPIQYYAQVDFQTFIDLIDKIDGIDVQVPNEIVVGLYGGNGGVVTLEPGLDHMDGHVALGYARNRYTQYGDVDRSGRQMQVIMAIRDKVLSPKNFPTLVAQSGAIYNSLSTGIHTNMSLPDALRLARLAQEIPPENIKQGLIDYKMMIDTKAPDGTDILRPFPDKIRELRDEIFGGGALSPVATTETPDQLIAQPGASQQLMKDEAASVVVINGTSTAGLAAKTADYLKSQGMNVKNFGNINDYPDKYLSPFPNQTVIIVHVGRPYAMYYLWSLMKLNSSSQFIVNFDPAAPADIIIGLGYDWAANNPMP